MAIKKSDLYSSLWASCDELRGGMDASQYKDYVLFMLFIKYITDKYGNSDDFAPPVTIPKGASFKDMIALKGSGRSAGDGPLSSGFVCSTLSTGCQSSVLLTVKSDPTETSTKLVTRLSMYSAGTYRGQLRCSARNLSMGTRLETSQAVAQTRPERR
jgi:hypothetical protein